MRAPHPTPYTPHPRRRLRRRGFTLIEAALTTVIVGTGVLAIVAAQQAYHQKNDWAQRTGTAMLLANEIRELTLTMNHHDPITAAANLGPEANEFSPDGMGGTFADPRLFDDLDDFAGTGSGGNWTGTTINPPINALRQQITDMGNWTQVVVVENVLPENISSSYVQALATTPMMRVTVSVLYQDTNDPAPETITRLSWIVPE